MEKQILNSATAAAMVEQFSKDFQKKMQPDNTFYLATKGETSNAISINIPQWYLSVDELDSTAEGSAATPTLWAEKSIAVTQKKFRSKALVISDWNEFFTAQSMRNDAIDSLKRAMDTQVGNYAAYKWAKAAADTSNILYSTGTDTRASEVVGGATSVKKITKSDILKAKAMMAKTNLPGQWNALISADALSDLFEINEFVTANQLGEAQSRLLKGEFAEIMGIRFFLRNANKGANFAFAQTTGSGATNTFKDIYGVDGTAATIDNTYVGGILFWNSDAIYGNFGINKTYLNEGNALYQGDMLSMQMGYGTEVIATAGNTTSPVTNKPCGVVILEEGR